MYELYKGVDIIVDYHQQHNKAVKSFFESSSNLEGFATLDTVNEEEYYFTIEQLVGEKINLDYLIVFTEDNEYEYYKI